MENPTEFLKQSTEALSGQHRLDQFFAFKIENKILDAVKAIRHVDLGIQPDFIPYMNCYGHPVYAGLKEVKDYIINNNHKSQIRHKWESVSQLILSARLYGLSVERTYAEDGYTPVWVIKD